MSIKFINDGSKAVSLKFNNISIMAFFIEISNVKNSMNTERNKLISTHIMCCFNLCYNISVMKCFMVLLFVSM